MIIIVLSFAAIAHDQKIRNSRVLVPHLQQITLPSETTRAWRTKYEGFNHSIARLLFLSTLCTAFNHRLIFFFVKFNILIRTINYTNKNSLAVIGNRYNFS